MAALTSVLFVALFTSSWIFVPCQGTQELKETAGEDVTLQCQSNSSADITVLRWTRADLKPDDYILFFRDDGSKLLNESYRGRVELRDPEMKDGDASVILKNVTINDTGTYECWIREKNEARRRKRAAGPKLISTIELKVTGLIAGHKEGGGTDGGDEEGGGTDGGDEEGGGTDGGDKEGGGQDRNVGPMVGLTVFAVLLVAVAVVGTMIFKKRRGKTAHPAGETHSLNPSTSA